MVDRRPDSVLLIKPAVLHAKNKEKVSGKLTLSKLALKWEPELLTTAQPVRLEINFVTGAQIVLLSGCCP